MLIRLGRKPYTHKHDLVELFGMIGRRNRAKIKRYFDANRANVADYILRAYEAGERPIPKATFDFVLSASKDAFKLFRYIFEEGMPADKGWLAGTIIDGARLAILDMRPEWTRAQQVSPR